MDNSLSESARFAVYREKLKGICEANNLSYVFIKNAYPIKLVIRPLGGVGEQMSMLEEATEDNYISPGASILLTVKDGNLTYRMSKTFTISDTLFNKIKNIFKNMHYLWLQFFFRDLVEGGKLAALGYKMPDIPESGGQQDALNTQKWNHYRDDIIAKLQEFARRVDDADRQKYSYVKSWGSWKMNCKDEFTVPDDAGKVEYVFEVGKTDIILYKKRDAAVEDEENAAREAARAADELAHEQFSSTTKFMYELRRDFVKDLTPAECKKHFSAIMEYATPLLSGYGRVRDDENVLHLLGVALDEQVQDDTELEDTLKMFNAYDTEPEKVLLAMAFDAQDGERTGYWSAIWSSEAGKSVYKHNENIPLNRTYELLTALGYEMADDEKALQEGTHRLFAVCGSGSKADTPCDKCKVAHPECDKCCKTCDDHCNAFQLCRKEYGE